MIFRSYGREKTPAAAKKSRPPISRESWQRASGASETPPDRFRVFRAVWRCRFVGFVV
jgi:hypothetical protein